MSDRKVDTGIGCFSDMGGGSGIQEQESPRQDHQKVGMLYQESNCLSQQVHTVLLFAHQNLSIKVPPEKRSLACNPKNLIFKNHLLVCSLKTHYL